MRGGAGGGRGGARGGGGAGAGRGGVVWQSAAVARKVPEPKQKRLPLAVWPPPGLLLPSSARNTEMRVVTDGCGDWALEYSLMAVAGECVWRGGRAGSGCRWCGSVVDRNKRLLPPSPPPLSHHH